MKIRKCNTIKWNENSTNLIACVYEPVFFLVYAKKLKDEESLYIWDLNKEPVINLIEQNYYGAKITGPIKLKTRREKIEDVCWVPDSFNKILSVTEKTIRLYDIGRVEEDIGHISIKKEKGLFSKIIFDPDSTKRFIHYYGNEISVWDLSYLKEPIFTFKHENNLQENPIVLQQQQSNLCVNWLGLKNTEILASANTMKGSPAIMNFYYMKSNFSTNSAIKKEPVQCYNPIIKSKEIDIGESISDFCIVPNSSDILTVFHSVFFIYYYRK